MNRVKLVSSLLVSVVVRTAQPEWMHFAEVITPPLPGEFGPILEAEPDWTVARRLLAALDSLIDTFASHHDEEQDIDDPLLTAVGTYIVGIEVASTASGNVYEALLVEDEWEEDDDGPSAKRRKRADDLDDDEPLELRFRISNNAIGIKNDYKYRMFLIDTHVVVPVFHYHSRPPLILQASYGPSLADIARSDSLFVSPAIRVKAVLMVVVRALNNLESMHRAGIVHGSVLPSSVVLRNDVLALKDLENTDVAFIDFDDAEFYPDAVAGSGRQRDVVTSSAWQIAGLAAGPRDDVYALIEMLADILSGGALRQAIRQFVHAQVGELGANPARAQVSQTVREAGIQIKSGIRLFMRADHLPAGAGELLERIVVAIRHMENPQELPPYEGIRQILSHIIDAL